MKNREWLLNKMQNMSDEELAEILDDGERICGIIDKPNFKCGSNCQKCITEWLKREVKPALSEAERIILENIDKEYKWIARLVSGKLSVFTKRPSNCNGTWSYCGKSKDIEVFNHLFQFITGDDEEPYSIEELLKGE